MRWLVVLLFQVCLSQAATYVIAAGVEQYDDPQVSRLTYAVADARSVASAFRASGVPPKNVVLLTSDAKDAAKRPTRIGLLRAFGQVKQQAATDDKLVFFFAGHGVERNGEQYLLGSDTQRDLLEETALPMGVVNKALDGLACGEVLFLIDACRNDPQAGRGDADAELSEEFARGLRPRIGGPTAKPRLVATLLACDAGQRAWESPEDGHGAFSMYLVKALSGQAAGENGQVTLSSLADYVGREVASWASRSKREQRPRLISPDGGDMVILTAPPEPVVSVAFQNHTLAQVVDLLAEQFSAQIVLGPGADAALTVTGRLDNQPLGTVLKVLVAAHGLTVRREGKVYIIEGDPSLAKPVAPEPAGPAAPQAVPETSTPAGIEFVPIPAGNGVASFELGKYDVTVAQFRRFVESTRYQTAAERNNISWGYSEGGQFGMIEGLNWHFGRNLREQAQDDWPVTHVTFDDAVAFAQWISGRLPTADEWEHASRGGTLTRYWWGDEWPPTEPVGNFGEGIEGYHDGHEGVAPVGSFKPNRYGLYDMSGNVWQIVDTPNRMTCRGGSFDFASEGYFTSDSSSDGYHGAAACLIGFRVARDIRDAAAAPAETSATAPPSRPANWPTYLADFQPPEGMDWSSFRVREKDGMPQVLIPAGEFMMGCPDGEGLPEDRPRRQVSVSGFWVDLHEVTNAQFDSFARSSNHDAGSEWLRWNQSTGPQFPANYVSWEDAAAYASWVSARLPTEAQWEKAARGGSATRYPWGQEANPSMANGDFDDDCGGWSFENACRHMRPVATTPPNAFGVYDMIGNVSEWCLDYYQPDWLAIMPTLDPVNTRPARAVVRRGGCWGGFPLWLQVASRVWDLPENRNCFNGFRCVQPADQP